jgi:signal recognition particle receptor subunit alpha
LGLVFVAVYQASLSLLYIDELLAAVKESFVDEYAPGRYAYDPFSAQFMKILRDCEARADAARRNAAALQQQQPTKAAAAAAATKAAAAAAAAKKGGQGGKGQGGASSGDGSGSDSDGDGDESSATAAAAGSGVSGAEGSSSGEEEAAGGGGFDVAKLRSLSRKAGGGPPGRRNVRRAAVESADAKPAVPAASAAPGKKKVCAWGVRVAAAWTAACMEQAGAGGSLHPSLHSLPALPSHPRDTRARTGARVGPGRRQPQRRRRAGAH